MQNKDTKNREWYLFDAKDQAVGRLSTEIADILRGKKKVDFAPNLDNGDFVVVVNADKVIFTGHKEDQKRYYSHSGYLGNLKTKTVADLRKDDPAAILKHAVSGMLPNNKLKDGFLSRFKIYAEANHPHKNIKFKNSK